MRLAALTTLRHSFDHVWPIVDELRDRGLDVPVYSTWTSAPFADPIARDDLAAAADLWIVASSSDARYVAPRPVIYVEHGTGQTYDGDERTLEDPSWSTGIIPNAVLFLCPNQFVAQRRQNRHPNVLAIVVGCPHLDAYVGMHGHHPLTERQTVALAFGWDQPRIPETCSAFEHYRPSLRSLAIGFNRRGWRTVATAHPRSQKLMRFHLERSGWEWWDPEDVLTSAEVCAFDTTSLGYEFAALDRPVVLLNAPWYRRNVSHGLRFWECLPGAQVDEPTELIAAVMFAADNGPWNDPCVKLLYPVLDGRASARSADAVTTLVEWLGARTSSKRHSPRSATTTP